MNKGFFGISPKFWIGQVPPFQTTNKTDPNRWGDRVKVRIMGIILQKEQSYLIVNYLGHKFCVPLHMDL